MQKVLAAILGAIVASAVFFLVAFVDNAVRPTPVELMDPATPEAVAERVESTPVSKWLVVMFGLALGSFVGGITGAKVAGGKTVCVAISIGLLLTPWAGYTFYVVYPAVLWVPIGMLISVFLFSYLGGCVVRSHNK
ncbi:MAG: hypothetical protein H8E20_12505 [Verrucomicrobia bacterium]|nr:hypothetical protein [Verrucomicrobiota bacterium]